jgi:hypothetical protein
MVIGQKVVYSSSVFVLFAPEQQLAVSRVPSALVLALGIFWPDTE